MTSEQFLEELGEALYGLNQEDRDNTLQFYKEYFEDAGAENTASVIEELGSPKKLAEEILSVYKTSGRAGSNDKPGTTEICKKLQDGITSLRLDVTSAYVHILQKDFASDVVEYKTENIPAEDIKIKTKDGELSIEERPLFSMHKKMFSDFFRNVNFNKVYDETVKRKITIYIPKTISLEQIELNIQFGSITIEDVEAEKITGYTACGNFAISNFECEKIYFNTSAGAISLINGKAEIVKMQSSAGLVKLETINAEKISASTGAGSITMKRIEAECIHANSGAGSVVSENVTCDKGNFNTGAGKIDFTACKLEDSFINAGAGSITVRGQLKSRTEINSSLGKIDLELSEPLDNYCMKVYAKKSFRLNDKIIETDNGVKKVGNTDAENRIRIVTNFGKVTVTTNGGQ